MLSKPLPLARERPPKISATLKFCTFHCDHSTLECVHAAWSVQHEQHEAQKMGRSVRIGCITRIEGDSHFVSADETEMPAR